jgi:hypothetical protein
MVRSVLAEIGAGWAAGKIAKRREVQPRGRHSGCSRSVLGWQARKRVPRGSIPSAR